MKLIINGEESTFEGIGMVSDLVAKVNPDSRRVAVLVNDMVVKADAWSARVLREGDRIEILTFAGGG